MLYESPCADALNDLCNLMDDYLDRQRDLLAVCEAQGKAARMRDTATLQEKTRAMEMILQEIVRDEPKRIALLRKIVKHHPLPEGQATMSAFIQSIPEPWARRLREFQEGLRPVVMQSRSILAENNRVMYRIQRRVRTTLDLLLGRAERAGVYTHRGKEPSTGNRISLLDARG